MSLNGKDVTYGVALIKKSINVSCESLEYMSKSIEVDKVRFLELIHEIEFLTKLFNHLNELQENELKQ